jgi:hypothetical protein
MPGLFSELIVTGLFDRIDRWLGQAVTDSWTIIVPVCLSQNQAFIRGFAGHVWIMSFVISCGTQLGNRKLQVEINHPSLVLFLARHVHLGLRDLLAPYLWQDRRPHLLHAHVLKIDFVVAVLWRARRLPPGLLDI